MTAVPPRIFTLDVLRGVAVMGILAANMIGFALPQSAALNPLIAPGAGHVDVITWTAGFVLVDGKMRALFSILFGASLALISDRAAAAGADAADVHLRRTGWLLAFGIAHYFLIWWGDILISYALIGLIAFAFVDANARSALRAAVLSIAVGIALAAALTVPTWSAGVAGWTEPASEIELYRSGYVPILHDRLSAWWAPLWSLWFYGPETLGYMLLGIWGLRSGFLTGARPARLYRRTAIIAIGFGLPITSALALAALRSAFDPGAMPVIAIVATAPLRPIIAIGYAAVVILAVRHGVNGPVASRVAAAGRAAFSNYLGASLVCTTIFYGYGLGLFGTLGRAELLLLTLLLCLAMLAWSKAWLERFRYGPFEWLWRRLSRGKRA